MDQPKSPNLRLPTRKDFPEFPLFPPELEHHPDPSLLEPSEDPLNQTLCPALGIWNSDGEFELSEIKVDRSRTASTNMDTLSTTSCAAWLSPELQNNDLDDPAHWLTRSIQPTLIITNNSMDMLQEGMSLALNTTSTLDPPPHLDFRIAHQLINRSNGVFPASVEQRFNDVYHCKKGFHYLLEKVQMHTNGMRDAHCYQDSLKLKLLDIHSIGTIDFTQSQLENAEKELLDVSADIDKTKESLEKAEVVFKSLSQRALEARTTFGNAKKLFLRDTDYGFLVQYYAAFGETVPAETQQYVRERKERLQAEARLEILIRNGSLGNGNNTAQKELQTARSVQNKSKTSTSPAKEKGRQKKPVRRTILHSPARPSPRPQDAPPSAPRNAKLASTAPLPLQAVPQRALQPESVKNLVSMIATADRQPNVSPSVANLPPRRQTPPTQANSRANVSQPQSMGESLQSSFTQIGNSQPNHSRLNQSALTTNLEERQHWHPSPTTRLHSTSSVQGTDLLQFGQNGEGFPIQQPDFKLKPEALAQRQMRRASVSQTEPTSAQSPNGSPSARPNQIAMGKMPPHYTTPQTSSPGHNTQRTKKNQAQVDVVMGNTQEAHQNQQTTQTQNNRSGGCGPQQ